MTTMLFDDSLPALVRTLTEKAGVDFVQGGTAVRDASGRLMFVAAQPPKSQNERKALERALLEVLGPYARADRPIIFGEDAGAQSILSAPERLPIQLDNIFCHLLDRRIVGAGWLDRPPKNRQVPPRIVFSTLKGGVGRSTALVVTAMDLARRNRNVLVIDLDLEAPGLGDLLLEGERNPDLGVVDFLVENGLGGVEDNAIASFVGSSELTTGVGGRVDVVPALGRKSLSNPENILPKLSRAMIEDITNTGDTISVAQQISDMIYRITDREEYDVVLIDSRAGLAELAAPAVIGLGATVLLFGTAQKQTIEGYRALFAALRLLAQRDRALGEDADWRIMLRPVYAKASFNQNVGKRFRDEMYELYSEYIYDAESTSEDDIELLHFLRDDIEAPHWPLIIPFNQNFIDFDPSRAPDQLTQTFYEQTFRAFLDGIDNIVATSSKSETP
jgi:cellulose biosynthesis protein BcsQ